MDINKVCVYCASSNQVAQHYFQAAEVLATALVKAGITIVYGGGGMGLMGRVADTAIQLGGSVTGIIPRFMKEVEWAHQSVTELVVVEDMHERKKKLIEGTDAVIALPGGSGTLEELFEVITLKRLGMYTKPIVILNINGFYDPLITLMERFISERFMAEYHREMWTVTNDPATIVEVISNAPVWKDNAINFAALK
mgnify:FL=1